MTSIKEPPVSKTSFRISNGDHRFDCMNTRPNINRSWVGRNLSLQQQAKLVSAAGLWWPAYSKFVKYIIYTTGHSVGGLLTWLDKSMMTNIFSRYHVPVNFKIIQYNGEYLTSFENEICFYFWEKWRNLAVLFYMEFRGFSVWISSRLSCSMDGQCLWSFTRTGWPFLWNKSINWSSSCQSFGSIWDKQSRSSVRCANIYLIAHHWHAYHDGNSGPVKLWWRHDNGLASIGLLSNLIKYLFITWFIKMCNITYQDKHKTLHAYIAL